METSEDRAAGTTREEALLMEILRRLEALDARMEALSRIAAQNGGAALAVATDAFDDVVAGLQARGVDVDARLAQALRLLEAFTEPKAAAALERLAGRIDDLDRLTARLSELPPGIAVLVDVFDAMAARAAAEGDDFDSRLRALATALDALTRPRVTEALTRLSRHLPRLADLLEEAPGLVGAAVDFADATADALRRRGLDPDVVTRRLAAVGRAFVEGLSQPAPPLGLWGAVREARRPTVRRALGLALGLADRIGGILPAEGTEETAPRRLEAGRNESHE